jgi:uncharacterized phage protein (TIGR02218 family)
MAVSANMIDHLASNVTWLCEVWKIVARDSTTVAYAAHTRNITYNSTTYQASSIEPTQSTRKLGLEADSFEISGAFDDTLTEASILAGKWKGARVTKERINYLNPAHGYATKEVGFAGKVSLSKSGYTFECLSLSSLLSQEIGDLTSPLDRRRRLSELGISIVAHTHARTVSSFTDRRNFVVGGSAQTNDYFANGVATFTSGLNSGLEMEVKSNTGNTIELQLPMPYNIANGDGVTLYRGYDGTRATATALGTMAAFDGEPDVPGINELISYPST